MPSYSIHHRCIFSLASHKYRSREIGNYPNFHVPRRSSTEEKHGVAIRHVESCRRRKAPPREGSGVVGVLPCQPKKKEKEQNLNTASNVQDHEEEEEEEGEEEDWDENDALENMCKLHNLDPAHYSAMGVVSRSTQDVDWSAA